MAIFQPTSIIPSSFTQGTVDAVKDNMEVSWQVNGNSAMTAFQIDFYLNDTASTPVYSTGRIDNYSYTEPTTNKTISLPFYGTDRFGRPQFFTYNAQKNWNVQSLNKFTNGNNYKFKITQFFVADKDEYNVKTAIVYTGGDYWFKISNTLYASFTLPSGSYPIGTQIFYNTRTKQGYYLQGNQESIIAFAESTTQPISGANLGDAKNEVCVEQTSFDTFITRTAPTLSISTAAYADFSGATTPLTNGSNYAKSIGYFIADYEQLQGDSIRWVRWQVATATYNAETEKWVAGDILADTGDIYTPTLNFEFNGFFNGNQYAIRCFGESESGQSCDTDWVFFNINYAENTYTGNFIAQCLHKENVTLLEWEGVEVILPTTEGNYTLNNGSVTLTPEATISWQQTKENATVPFGKPWTAVWKGKLDNSDNLSTELSLSGTTSELATTIEKKIIFTEETYVIESNPDFDVYGGIFSQPLPDNYISYDESSITIRTIEGMWTTSLRRIWVENNRINISVYSGDAPTTFELTVTTICANEYKITVNGTVDGTIFNYKDITASSNVTRYNVSYSGSQLSVELFSADPASVSISLTVEYSVVVYGTQGTLLTLNGANLTLSRQDNPLILKVGETQLASVAVPDNSTSVATVITPTTLNAYFYDDNGLISQSSTPITYTQQPITSVSIYGGDSGATVESVSVYQGNGGYILSLYQNDPNFEPVWNASNYQLYMTANFNGNLEGGTGTSSGKGFQIYRQEVGKNVPTPIANVSSKTTSLKDYGISSRKAYKYSLYAYDSNSAFMGGVEADNVIATNFKNYSLLVCDYDYDKDEYHVRKQYLFALNLTSGSVGNNNSPTLNKNFTQYPTRMADTANYASGTLSGLIGAIYTVPALIEQIGQYKWTAKPSTMDYFDSVDLEKELYDLSTAPYQLFLRDMKGRLRMIATNGAISMTTNIKQKQQSISISFPWVEIGDASDVTIIQTPNDYGWNNDNQVLDVQLDVDVETGELSATYPFPYNGTKFYLTGINKENLTAKTPLGVTPAQFNLSDTATQTTDGEVTATVTVNSETNSNNN